jgi:hypothetical protein
MFPRGDNSGVILHILSTCDLESVHDFSFVPVQLRRYTSDLNNINLHSPMVWDFVYLWNQKQVSDMPFGVVLMLLQLPDHTEHGYIT